MRNAFLVCAGGALGSAARYAVTSWCLRVAPELAPFGVMLVNVAGSFVFGLLAGAAEARLVLSGEARLFLFAGVLGGFTTFSTYAFDAVVLLRDAQFLRASVYILGQVVAGLLALAAGMALTR